MTTDERMGKIEGQLARVRWFNRCLIACIVLSLGVWFILKSFGPETAWAKSGVKEIRATRFIVEDENGEESAMLGMGDNGPALLMKGKNGKIRVTLLADYPALTMRGGDGKICALLAVADDGPLLKLADTKSKRETHLIIIEEGLGLALYDENGTVRSKLSMDKAGPSLLLFDENENARAALTMLKDFRPKLSLLDENEKEIWRTP